MIDLYCNCHYLIGLLGWMNITSNMLQLGRFQHSSLNFQCTSGQNFETRNLASAAILLLNMPRLQNNFKLSIPSRGLDGFGFITIFMLNLYVLFCNTLYDTRPYENLPSGNDAVPFHNSHWYGLWNICGTKTGVNQIDLELTKMDVCTKWTDPVLGIWTPSPYWDNPKPVGTYYMATMVIVSLPIAIAGVLLNNRFKRFCYIALFLTNYIMAIGITCVIDALPISGKSSQGQGHFRVINF